MGIYIIRGICSSADLCLIACTLAICSHRGSGVCWYFFSYRLYFDFGIVYSAMPFYHVVAGACAMPDGSSEVLSSTSPGYAESHQWDEPIRVYLAYGSDDPPLGVYGDGL